MLKGGNFIALRVESFGNFGRRHCETKFYEHGTYGRQCLPIMVITWMFRIGALQCSMVPSGLQLLRKKRFYLFLF